MISQLAVRVKYRHTDTAFTAAQEHTNRRHLHRLQLLARLHHTRLRLLLLRHCRARCAVRMAPRGSEGHGQEDRRDAQRAG